MIGTPKLNLKFSRTRPECPIDLYYSSLSETSDKRFLSEEMFREYFFRECSRSERTGNHFILLLIDIEPLLKNLQTINVQELHDALTHSVRQTDVLGWYKKTKVYGVIYADATQNGDFFANRMRQNLHPLLSVQQRSLASIVYMQFPRPHTDADINLPSDNLSESLYSSGERIRQKTYATMKRSFDICFSLLVLIVMSPLFLVVGLLIKLTSKGPVFYIQERVGLKGRPFRIFKFRSMHTGCDISIHRQFVADFISGKNVAASANGEKVHKMTNDPRITKIGRFIRKTSIDELPQFINVLLGDMSVVGPRPPIAYEVEAYNRWHTHRVMKVKPGITGTWQVYGRSRTDFDNMVRMDINYIRKRSFLLDLKLVFMTPISLLTTSGAY
ncbi:MAG: sugar transferase [Chitinispirillaceae bacterium]|nr:sugar transferase [Chitinispirillaceae bacterium]